MLTGLLVFAAIAVAVLWLLATYNQLVAIKQRATQAWANIDVLLRQRHDELPKLVEVCRDYLKFEQLTFDRVLDARAAIFGARQTQDAAALGEAENELRRGLERLLERAERDETLREEPAFIVLEQRIAALQSGIVDRRELYNDAVSENNVAIRQFPRSIVARFGGFRPLTPLEFETPR